jgi:hypothetical protein
VHRIKTLKLYFDRTKRGLISFVLFFQEKNSQERQPATSRRRREVLTDSPSPTKRIRTSLIESSSNESRNDENRASLIENSRSESIPPDLEEIEKDDPLRNPVSPVENVNDEPLAQSTSKGRIPVTEKADVFTKPKPKLGNKISSSTQNIV